MRTPRPTIIYNKTVGDLRQKNLAKVLREWGYSRAIVSLNVFELDHIF